MTIACPDCGAVQDLLPLPRRAVASCVTCGNELERTAGRSITAAFALSFSVLLLYTAANILPFLRTRMLGFERESRIGSIVPLLLDTEWVLVAFGITAFIVALPIIRFALLSLTLGALRFGFRPAWLGRSFRWAVLLDGWSMPDILLVGAAIGYTRVAARLPVEIGAGGWCFLAAAGLAIITDAALDCRAVWRSIRLDAPPPPDGPVLSCTTCDLVAPAEAEGSACPRCGATLHLRKPDALRRTTALVLAALLLYPPANIWPIIEVMRLGETERQTIMHGVYRLIEAELVPLAGIIFFTSIVIPLAKLGMLGWFVLSVRFRWRRGLKARTRLHRSMIGFGRWSNVDIMIVSVFAPLMQFGQLVKTEIATGGACFFAVVVLTMLASRSFDSRLMWDAVKLPAQGRDDERRPGE